jgi:hypothetical protein
LAGAHSRRSYTRRSARSLVQRPLGIASRERTDVSVGGGVFQGGRRRSAAGHVPGPDFAAVASREHSRVACHRRQPAAARFPYCADTAHGAQRRPKSTADDRSYNGGEAQESAGNLPDSAAWCAMRSGAALSYHEMVCMSAAHAMPSLRETFERERGSEQVRAPESAPENRPESLMSFRAANWRRARPKETPCKCARSSEPGSAPDRIRTCDLRFRRSMLYLSNAPRHVRGGTARFRGRLARDAVVVGVARVVGAARRRIRVNGARCRGNQLRRRRRWHERSASATNSSRVMAVIGRSFLATAPNTPMWSAAHRLPRKPDVAG